MTSQSRAAKIRELGLQYPVWVFCIDESRWPLKLKGIMQRAIPARLMGWASWPWEYGTAVRRVDDPIPTEVIEWRKGTDRLANSIETALPRLFYDDNYQRNSLEIICTGPGTNHGEQHQPLSDCSLDPTDSRYQDPRAIISIQRTWDQVPFWDKRSTKTVFGSDSEECAYGVAVLVRDDDELVEATGVVSSDNGSSMRRVEMDVLGDESGVRRGLVFPERWHAPGDRGLIVSRGPDYKGNKELLYQSVLENASWEEVVEFVEGRRRRPLLCTNMSGTP